MKLSFVPLATLLSTIILSSLTVVVVDAKMMAFMNPFDQSLEAGRSLSSQNNNNVEQHAQKMKKVLNKRRLEAARREIAMKRQAKSGNGNTAAIIEPLLANEMDFHRALSSKKSATSKSGKGSSKAGKGGKGSSSKTGKGSKKSTSSSKSGGKGSKKKSTKRSSGKGQVVATHPPTTPPPTMAAVTPPPTMTMTSAPSATINPAISIASQDDGPMMSNSADGGDIDNTPPPIVSEDIPTLVASEDQGPISFDENIMPDIDNTPPPISEDRGPVSDDFRAPPISSEDDQGGPVSDDFRAPPISSEDDQAAANDPNSGDAASSDGAQDNDSNANADTPSTGDGGDQDEEPSAGDSQGSDATDGGTTDEPDQGDVAGDDGDGDGDATNNEEEPPVEDEAPVAEPVEILTEEWEFAMVRTAASSADKEEDFNLTSVIVMTGVLYDFAEDGSVNMEDGEVGDFTATCTVVSKDHNVLCAYRVHLITDGDLGIGEFMARGHVVDHQNENLALVTGTAFDMSQYTKGGTLVMQPNPDDVLTLTCSLTLRYVKDDAGAIN